MLWLLIGYMFLFVERPFELYPFLGTIHLERIYMFGTLIAAALAPSKRWLPNWQHTANVVFAAVVLLCWAASPWADAGEQLVEDYFKVMVFYFLIVLLVHDEHTLKRLVLAFLGVMFFYMSHSLWEYVHGRHTYRMGIVRMIGVDTTLGDPNSFGASIIYALPFVTLFWVCQPTRKVRIFLAAYVALSFVCIGLTGSRGSFIALLVWVVIQVLRSRWRWRLLALSLVLAPVLWAALPESLQNRFGTIVDPSLGPKNAEGSAESRIEGLVKGLELWGRFPLTGCGPGAFRPSTGSLLETHNMYGELLGETGTLGALAFLGVLGTFGMNLWRNWKAYRHHPEWDRKRDFLYQLNTAIAIALFFLLFLGNFGHNLFRYSWLWYGGFLIIARHCIQQRALASAGRVTWRVPVLPRLRPRPFAPA